MRKFTHAKVVNDQKWGRCDRFHAPLARAVHDRFGEFFEQNVGFAIQYAVALLNRSVPDGLRPYRLGRERAHLHNAMKLPAARSNTKLRFIFGLKVKSKFSIVRLASRKPACLRRRSSKRSERRVSSSETQIRDQIDGPPSVLPVPDAGAFRVQQPYRRDGFGLAHSVNLERKGGGTLTLRQVDPLIRELSLYRDVIDRREQSQSNNPDLSKEDWLGQKARCRGS